MNKEIHRQNNARTEQSTEKHTYQWNIISGKISDITKLLMTVSSNNGNKERRFSFSSTHY